MSLCMGYAITWVERTRPHEEYTFGVVPQFALSRGGNVLGLDEMVSTCGGPLRFPPEQEGISALQVGHARGK